MSATTTDTDCPVSRLAREAAAVANAHARADAAGDQTGAEDLEERLEGIETAATFARASSSLGAFFQALILVNASDEQNVWFDDDQRAKQAARRMARLATSIVGQLEASADAATVKALRRFYLSPKVERHMMRAAVLNDTRPSSPPTEAEASPTHERLTQSEIDAMRRESDEWSATLEDLRRLSRETEN